VLSHMLIQDELKKGTVVELQVEGLHLDREFRIIYHKNKLLTNLAKEFIEMCRTHK
ncbi:MAG TPA: LysR family transcriptional regulator, partial [Clostridiaceae bacterium]|nr:LysR family transcriptional regulator [Clostridiaceae bacterium]